MTGFGTRFQLSTGRPAALGRQLGKGGEGAVYEIDGDSSVVAKIYNAPISPQKAQKLAAMVQLADPTILKFAAWPLATIGPKSSDIRGFVMPRLNGYRPLHDLYNPASRRTTFPKADWKYLLHSARNVAAAIAAVHSKGCVVGDVNQGNAWVHESQALIRLIDCDSFQISLGPRTWLCEVGVGHFTPPEVQGWRSFKDRPRTANHDGFGLAVLLFHILFFGRHPYSGVYSGNQDVPLEKAIERHWFAYSSRARASGIAAPPGTVPLTVVGTEVGTLFEQAFSTTTDARPHASRWVQALDALEHALKRCSEDAAHVFSGHLKECPWCALEERTGALLFVSQVSGLAGLTGRFNSSAVWATIESIKPPGPAPSADLSQLPTPQGVVQSKQVMKTWTLRAARFSAVAGAAFLIVQSPGAWFLWGLLGWGVWHWVAGLGPDSKPYQEAVRFAEDAYKKAVAHWGEHTGDQRFVECKGRLERLRSEYSQLPGQYQKNLVQLKQDVYNAQKHRFLERFLVRDGNIQGVKEGRKQTLQSFGIQTAADATPSKIGLVPGFGPVLTDAVLKWRAHCESKFVFDKNKGVDPADVAALNKRFEHMRRVIEDKLQKGAQELLTARDEILKRRKLLHPTVMAAGQALLQARANLKALSP